MSNALQSCQTFVEKSANGEIQKIYALKDNQLFIIIVNEDVAKVVINTLPEVDIAKVNPTDNGDYTITVSGSNGKPITINSKGQVLESSMN